MRWYRTRFYDRNPDRDESLPHLEFLHHWGLIVETGGRLLPTRAAVLLFGVDPAFRQVLPRPVVGLAVAPRGLVGGLAGGTLGPIGW